jgi:hypothetical protein
MSNETKRDVLKKALDFFVATGLVRNINYNLESYQYLSEYDAALPDDLPVIPKDVSEYIKKAKAPGKWGLLDVFWHLGDHISAMGFNGLYDWEQWMVDNQDTVSRAWVLGVWRVYETGEIVKWEAEK